MEVHGTINSDYDDYDYDNGSYINNPVPSQLHPHPYTP